MADPQLHQDLLDLTSCIKALNLEVHEIRRDRRTDAERQVQHVVVPSPSPTAQTVAMVCGLCAAFMAGAVLVGGFWVSGELARNAGERAELRRTDNDFRDYISAIYQAAPDLQKRIEADKAGKESK